MLNIILFCLQVYNLGTGRGYSVLEMVKAVEKASGKTVSKGTHGSPEALVTGYNHHPVDTENHVLSRAINPLYFILFWFVTLLFS